MNFLHVMESTILVYMMVLKTSLSIEISSIPSYCLKPYMYMHKYARTVAPCIFGEKKDYVCTLDDTQKKQLCKELFDSKKVHNYLSGKVMYSEDVASMQGFSYSCGIRKFDCYLNKIPGVEFSQEMLLCPLVDANGNPVNTYFVSTNYTQDRVIIFSAPDKDGRVLGVVGLWDVKLPDANSKPTSA